ncbi:AAA family ATPase [Luteimonas sp. RC10]|uniref:ParA family protein n=1 Tax=Luteimonas sp. RC10 TaxID=2587035 RepID=UPI00160D8563|nr:AAA family ATPase [Luteimonas sp. RC10]MBB3343058.1 cellulose biosynthesis protein BcsQ [Luteimonas sp. RC10]
METFCVFNNKGGVGKTTLLCNLAAYFALGKNKKVLVVDADPQCNATAYMLAESKVERIYASGSEGKTINSLITSLKKSRGYGPIPVVRSDDFGLDLVAGDPKFALAEDFLAKDWFDATNGQERGLKTTYFLKALIAWAEDQAYDYVFFDIGPSLGAINRTVLLTCDYFILPMSSDIFSLRGLQNIQVAIQGWMKGISRGLEVYEEENGEKFQLEGGVTIDEGGIKFLGYVTQQYTAKTVGGKKQPVKSYEKIIKRIAPAISKHLIIPLNNGLKVDYKLGEIPYFQSLVPMSQTSTKPIFALKSADGIVGAHFDKVKEFNKVICEIADNVENNVKVVDQ